jgi:hypothetical protein
MARTDDHATRTEIAEIAHIAARGLRDGTLTLKDVFGLTAKEMRALGQASDSYRQSGDLRSALKIAAALAACDPYNEAQWERMAELHDRLASPPGALLCLQVLALLRGRDANLVQRERECIDRLGFGEAASRLQPVARAFALAEHKQRIPPRPLRA